MKVVVKLIFLLICLVCCSRDKVPNVQIKDIKMELPFEKVYSVAGYNNKLYAMVSDQESDGLANTFVKYDIDNARTEVLFRSKYAHAALQEPKVNTDWCVWQDANSDGSLLDIYAKNMQRDEIHLLSNRNSSLYKTPPSLYKNFVVFAEAESNDEQVLTVRLYNLENNQIKTIGKINTPSLLNDSIEFKNGMIAYTDIVNGEFRYVLYNVNTNKEKIYKPLEETSAGYIQIIQDELLALNFDNVEDWDSQRLISFNTRSKKVNSEILNKDTYPIHVFKTFNTNLYIKNLKGKLIKYVYNKSRFKEQFSIELSGYFSIDNNERLIVIDEKTANTVRILSK